MSWRTVVITKRCKLSYKNNYLIIRNEDNNMMHLSEIGIIIIDSTLVSITSYLLAELVKRKIKVVFCDERRNPISELVPLYGAHNTSKRILNQTNREGHAAKVYFNSLFGKNFIRRSGDNTNIALDYGYAILVSAINKEIVSNGCMTQLGINHRNEFNYFNLSYDLVEPFRPLVDNLVMDNIEHVFDKEYKYKLVNVLNSKVQMDGKSYFLTNAIQIYIKNILNALDQAKVSLVQNIRLNEL